MAVWHTSNSGEDSVGGFGGSTVDPVAKSSFTVQTPWTAEKVFAYMADLTNLPLWDPGVHKVTQIGGSEPGLDAAFEVTVDGFSGPMTLTYVVTSFVRPERFRVKAEHDLLASNDETAIVSNDDGCTVTYSAELILAQSVGITDDAFSKTFEILASRAAHGLAEAIEGSVSQRRPS